MTNQPIHVRPFCLADAGEVEPWLQGPGLSLPPGAARQQWPHRLLADARIVARVAVHGARLVGFVRLDSGPDRVADLTLVVSPEYRRRGLGRLLFDAALVSARQLGLRQLVASVDTGNAVAIDFFVDRGFVFEDGAAVGACTSGRYLLTRIVHAGDHREPLEIEA
ncbi:MAG: GNAT family N-acetyltransferase [Planctomycetes bacterium]|nr:GNAT family N-acetyltransferase [Planctomycetota bacterium]